MTVTPQNPNPEQTVPPPEGENNAPPAGNVQIKTETVHKQNNTFYQYFKDGPQKPDLPLSSLLEEMPTLPPGLHPFRDPAHDDLLRALDDQRIVLLQSYREEASYAAAHTLISDQAFHREKKLALFPTRRRDKERDDLELARLTEKDFLRESQILLIEVDAQCTFFESVLATARGALGGICDKLRSQYSYIVLSVDECLLETEDVAGKIRGLYTHRVSHLRYLLWPHYAGRTPEIEAQLHKALGPLSTPAERREHYQRIADQLSAGIAAFEKFLAQLVAATPEQRAIQLRTVEPSAVFKEDSEVHRTAAFVAACFPELNQKDFDRLVRLLLGEEIRTEESVRQAFRPDGKLITVRERKDEFLADQWLRQADKIFRDCCLRTVASGNGAWAVDFCEPYLRDELRSYLDKHHPWYVRRQCERLQASGVLFFDDLSPKAVEGLVRLFIERAIVDPTNYGSLWLLRLMASGRTALSGGDLPESSDEMLAWLSEKLAQAHLRVRFQERVSIFIREMLDHDVLRPVVRQFFELLIASKQHDALLDLVLDLAPRLRFVPGFDPLIWLKRLLNQGRANVQEQTFVELVNLARRSGPRIYEFLQTIHGWLPDADRPPDGYSVSNKVAIQFPFAYCEEMAKWVTPGVWPSQHPLFYALPENATEAREKIAPLIEWIVDSRGAAFEQADAADPLQSAEAKRIGLVADLIEHWAWVLEGPPSETPPPEGKALFGIILEELDSRLSARERTWLQRSWQHRQEELLNQAASLSGQERKNLIARKTKLEQLRVQYATLAMQRTRI